MLVFDNIYFKCNLYKLYFVVIFSVVNMSYLIH